MSEQKQATPADELRRQFMDHSTPLNEAGHWARRHIEQLEAENNRLRASFARIVKMFNDALDAGELP